MTLSATDHAAHQGSARLDPRLDVFEQEAVPYMRQMFPAALRLTRNRCDAEDLIQETFTRAYQKFHLFSPGTNLRAWLHRIMFHVFYSNCRKRRRRPAEALAGDIYDTLEPGAMPASSSAESEALDQLATSPALRALRDLPDSFKTVVFLADVQGYQYAEIADIMGTPIGTVMSRIHRGRRMLRTKLAGEAGAVPPARGGAAPDQPAASPRASTRRKAPAQRREPAQRSGGQPDAPPRRPARARRDLPAPGPAAARGVPATRGEQDAADAPMAA